MGNAFIGGLMQGLGQSVQHQVEWKREEERRKAQDKLIKAQAELYQMQLKDQMERQQAQERVRTRMTPGNSTVDPRVFGDTESQLAAGEGILQRPATSVLDQLASAQTAGDVLRGYPELATRLALQEAETRRGQALLQGIGGLSGAGGMVPTLKISSEGGVGFELTPDTYDTVEVVMPDGSKRAARVARRSPMLPGAPAQALPQPGPMAPLPGAPAQALPGATVGGFPYTPSPAFTLSGAPGPEAQPGPGLQTGLSTAQQAQQAGAIEGAKETAKAQVAQLVDVRKSVKEELPKVREMLRTIDVLMMDPDLPAVLGRFAGPASANTGGVLTFAKRGPAVQAMIKQLKGMMSSAAFQTLKGGGSITEKETDFATAALGRLEQAQDYRDFLIALNDLRSVVRTSEWNILTAARAAGIDPDALLIPGGGPAGRQQGTKLDYYEKVYGITPEGTP